MHPPSPAHDSFRFSFEDLRAHAAAEAALVLVVEARGALKGAPGELLSQLERALVSVCLNLAEGAGRRTAPDQRRFYQIAFGSAAEAMAALRLLRVLGQARGELASAERMLREAGALTFRLIGATVR